MKIFAEIKSDVLQSLSDNRRTRSMDFTNEFDDFIGKSRHFPETCPTLNAFVNLPFGLNNHYLNDSCAKSRHVCMSQHQQINGDLSSRSICNGMIMRAMQKSWFERERSTRRLSRANTLGHLKLMNLTELCTCEQINRQERGCEETFMTMVAKPSSP